MGVYGGSGSIYCICWLDKFLQRFICDKHYSTVGEVISVKGFMLQSLKLKNENNKTNKQTKKTTNMKPLVI